MIYESLRNRENFNENPSMRAIAKICEHEQPSTRLNFASKSSKSQILRAVEKFYDHPILLLERLSISKGKMSITSSKISEG